MVGTEGRQGSAGSNEGGSASRSKDRSSGEADTVSEAPAPALQQQVNMDTNALAMRRTI